MAGIRAVVFDEPGQWEGAPGKGTEYLRADLMEAAIEAAVQAERERCAAVALKHGWTGKNDEVDSYYEGRRDCADLIERQIMKGSDHD